MTIRTRTSPLLFASVVFAASTAFAPAPVAAETAVDPVRAARTTELNEAGAKLYGERNYHRAIEKFIEAYAIDRDPNLLFNVARCYEELGDTRAAIDKYTAYLNAPGADAAGRLRAEQALRDLRELHKRAATNADARAARNAQPDVPTARTQFGGTSTDATDASAPASSSRALLAWSALAAGALLTGIGGTSFYLGMRDHDRVTGAPGYGNAAAVDPMTVAEARALVSSGDTKKLGGAIALGLGGALLATSAALFFVPTERSGTESTLAIGWASGASGFRAAWSVRF